MCAVGSARKHHCVAKGMEPRQGMPQGGVHHNLDPKHSSCISMQDDRVSDGLPMLVLEPEEDGREGMPLLLQRVSGCKRVRSATCSL